ncbi:TIGR04255 family protein [Haloferula sp. A504]|uniref:TIGR04255 family protein n=1 Tax=Haloferula sp. A504 TaxID=3373601 RepID=UPI0031C36F78|nr:TIGR04255 family protein [Verrucomicrobiaceae bacterium E54]
MSEPETLDPFKLPHPPIVEAVVDIDCDLPPGLDFAMVEEAMGDALKDHYPVRRKRLVHEAKMDLKEGEQPKLTARHGLAAVQFVAEDEKQIVQARPAGFSFNRLGPYGSFDEYLPEIERCWAVFVEVVRPVQVRKLGLRYINRIPIPLEHGTVNLADYLRVSPNLPEGSGLQFADFFHQHRAGDPKTGNKVNIILASQPQDDGCLPLLLDIEVFRDERLEPAPLEKWRESIEQLRSLKNHIFEHSLTQKCLNLFQ